MAMQKSSISVVVVKGEFLALYRLGFPFPALATMQDACDIAKEVHHRPISELFLANFCG